MIGVDASYATLIEQGKREPRSFVIGRIAAALRVDSSVLMLLGAPAASLTDGDCALIGRALTSR